MNRDTARTRSGHANIRPATSSTAAGRAPRLMAQTVEVAVSTAAAAVQRGQWEVGLTECRKVRDELQARTPRAVLAMGATCLHHLDRYIEAESWAQEGLGDQRALLTIPPIATEDAIRQRWHGAQEPVISILCTTYNHERYVESTIRGFLSQHISHPFEILIHDDASTDGTQGIIRRWQSQYPSLIRPTLQSENQLSKGIRPFELLLSQARGTFIATCEGDDFWVDPSKLQRQVDFLIANPDFSCTAHNYWHYIESTLTVNPWFKTRADVVMSQRQLMAVARLLWWPTLVFRKLFTSLPPERNHAAYGDFMVTSYLGTFGKCLYFDSMLSAVRRENAFSIWSPLSESEKEYRRVKTWLAATEMHANAGHRQAVVDLLSKVSASTLAEDKKSELLSELLLRQPALFGEAVA